MVKNTGGNKTKSVARKLLVNPRETSTIRLPQNVLEKFAFVTKMLGNGMCSVTLSDNSTLICHIRNKFRGRSKKNNIVTSQSIVLIGLREWETPSKNCDLLEIFDTNTILNHIPPSLYQVVKQLSSGQFNDTTSGENIVFEDSPEIIIPEQRIPPPIYEGDADEDWIDIDNI